MMPRPVDSIIRRITRVKISLEMASKVNNISDGWPRANANVLKDINNSDPITGFPELKPVQCRMTTL